MLFLKVVLPLGLIIDGVGLIFISLYYSILKIISFIKKLDKNTLDSIRNNILAEIQHLNYEKTTPDNT
ncbi:MAG: hypothetical protein NZ853_02815 [Leptospiraceae bacterium]|nr:hypothetical protein [Leptospiraceae bacterium]MDW7975107.1 hypothetical protein [Leptospiraceae bacterium]